MSGGGNDLLPTRSADFVDFHEGDAACAVGAGDLDPVAAGREGDEHGAVGVGVLESKRAGVGDGGAERGEIGRGGPAGVGGEALLAGEEGEHGLREAGRFRFVSSVLVEQEIVRAPERVRRLMSETFGAAEILPMTLEMVELARHYLAQKVVPVDFTDDARHVALCSVTRLDYLVSWNFKHLANVRRESGFNAVNILQGYLPVRIVAPTFLIHGHDEKDL